MRRSAPIVARGRVVRRFAPSNLAVALAAIGVGAGILVSRWRSGHVPLGPTSLALLVIGGGVALLASLRARACARCGSRLRLGGVRFGGRDRRSAVGALRSGDAPGALHFFGPRDPRGDVFAELWWCPTCRAVATLRVDGAEAILSGSVAENLLREIVPVDADDAA